MENMPKPLVIYTAAAALAMTVIYLGVKSYTTLHPRPLPTDQATITVSGMGDAVGIPDIATLSFSVVQQGDTVEQVTTTTNEAMNKIITTLKSAGIADEDIQTTGYNLDPRYDYTKVSRGDIIGYSLTQSVTVKVKNLDSIGEVVDAATAAGANDVSSPYFEIDEPETIKTEARTEAFSEAKAKADSLAEAAGVSLGDIVTFTESDNGYNPQPYYKSSGLELNAAVSDTAIEVGSKEVNVTVTVTYALEN